MGSEQSVTNPNTHQYGEFVPRPNRILIHKQIPARKAAAQYQSTSFNAHRNNFIHKRFDQLIFLEKVYNLLESDEVSINWSHDGNHVIADKNLLINNILQSKDTYFRIGYADFIKIKNELEAYGLKRLSKTSLI